MTDETREMAELEAFQAWWCSEAASVAANAAEAAWMARAAMVPSQKAQPVAWCNQTEFDRMLEDGMVITVSPGRDDFWTKPLYACAPEHTK